MKRLAIVALAVILSYIGITYFAMRIVPPHARHLLETGAELDLPTQFMIAGSNYWARWFVAIGVALAVGLAWWGARQLQEDARRSNEE